MQRETVGSFKLQQEKEKLQKEYPVASQRSKEERDEAVEVEWVEQEAGVEVDAEELHHPEVVVREAGDAYQHKGQKMMR